MMGRKHCVKRSKCWLPTFSPFPTSFSNTIFIGSVKTLDRLIKDITEPNEKFHTLPNCKSLQTTYYFTLMKMLESLPKRVKKKNTVGKREIARYEQFLFFSQSFQKTCTSDT